MKDSKNLQMPGLGLSDQYKRYIRIFDYLFGLDFEAERIVSLDLPDYAIAFDRLHRLNDELLAGYLDTQRGIYIGNATDDPGVQRFILQQRILEDVKLTETQIEVMNRLSNRAAFQTAVANEALRKRLHKIVPEINVGGNPHLIYWADRLLIHRGDPEKIIDLNRCTRVLETGGFQLYYNLKTGQAVDLHPRLIRFPQDVVSLVIPEGKVLDPVSVALEEGLRTGHYLQDWPASNMLTATVISLHNTPVPEMIRRNQIELEVQGAQHLTKHNHGKRI